MEKFFIEFAQKWKSAKRKKKYYRAKEKWN